MTLTKVNIKDIYRLSPMQEGMFFHALYDKSSSAYFEQTSFRYHKELNIELVEKSLDELVKRYDVLRTIFTQKIENEILQIVLRERKIDFHYEDISEKEDKEYYLTKFKNKDKKNLFDLTRDMLMRIAVFRLDDAQYEFIWSFHHIIMDGWCTGILVSEYFEIYNSYLANRPYQLPPVRPYREYIDWLEKQDKKNTKNYWQEYLAGYDEKAGIPGSRPLKTAKSEYKPGRVDFTLNEETVEGLNNLAGRNNTTLNVIFQALWGILLARYNNKNDVVFGKVVSGRPPDLEDVESMVGLFINTIPFRMQYEESMKLTDLLKEIQKNEIRNAPHHYYPLVEIQNESLLKQDLLDHIMIFENYPFEKHMEGIRPDISDIKGFEQTNYDFNTIIIPGNPLTVRFDFNGNEHETNYVKMIANHFSHLIYEVVNDEAQEIEMLEFLTKEERDRLLFDFNRTSADYPKEKTIHELFEEQVEQIPDYIAMLGEEGGKGRRAEGKKENNLRAKSQELIAITYKELNQKSHRLALLLKEKGVKPDTIVGLIVERSIEMIIGIYGILKAGGAYLPIDPQYPQERINYMIADSNTKFLVTTPDLSGKFNKSLIVNCQLLMTNEEPQNNSFVGSGDGFSNDVLAGRGIFARGSINKLQLEWTNLAYLIYTSGSTGKPKGVMVEHWTLVNRLNWMQKKYPLGPGDTILHKTPFTFDVSVWEISWWSTAGASVYLLAPGGEKDLQQIAAAIDKHLVTIVHFVPSMLSIFLEYIKQSDKPNVKSLTSLKQVIASGEALGTTVVKSFNRLLAVNGTALANLYGPTEATIDVSYFDCPAGENIDRIPIGKPIDNIRLLILRKGLQLQPVGVAGELCITGDGLARGYLNRSELTAEKFPPVFYRSYRSYMSYIPGKFYRTGDLARWLPDGNIEYLGRMDHQVKIRGNRIELGEIETRLNSHPAIKESVLTIIEDKSGGKSICAYLVSTETLTAAQLREYLGKQLPDYMIPSYFIPMEKIPLTPNGKIDRKALPPPAIAAKEAYVAPRDEFEERLTKIWSEVLGIKKDTIGINSNFFGIGGHSLKAAIMVAKIHKELNVKLSLADLFKKPTIKEVAKCIKNSMPYKYLSIEVTEKKEYYPLSPAQERLYFLHRVDKKSTSYNMPVVLRLEGLVNNNKLENVFTKLIKRHESLRTSFGLVDNKPVQQVINEVEFQLEYHKSGVNSQKKSANTGKNEHQIIKNFVRPFDLSRAPLLRVGLIKLAGEKITIMVDMHHIVSDGTSHDILIQDFQLLFRGEELQPLRIQYKDYSGWQHSKKETKELNRQEEYWLKQFQTGIPVLNLPIDYERPEVLNFKGSSMSFEIEKKLGADLKNLALELRTTLFVLLLTAYYILLAKYTLQNDIVVGSVVVGRHHADFQNIIGFFVNMVALRNHPGENKTFTDFLKEVNKSVFDAYENQDYQFEELVSKLAAEREPGRHPIVDTVLTLENIDIPPEDILDKKRDGFKLIPHEFEDKITHFDLLVQATAYKNSLVLEFEYSIALFEPSTIEKMAGHFIEVLKQAKENPNILLKNIILSHEFAAASMDANLLEEDTGGFVF